MNLPLSDLVLIIIFPRDAVNSCPFGGKEVEQPGQRAEVAGAGHARPLIW